MVFTQVDNSQGVTQARYGDHGFSPGPRGEQLDPTGWGHTGLTLLRVRLR